MWGEPEFQKGAPLGDVWATRRRFDATFPVGLAKGFCHCVAKNLLDCIIADNAGDLSVSRAGGYVNGLVIPLDGGICIS